MSSIETPPNNNDMTSGPRVLQDS
eukprot:COSAG05_NODE_22523_length_264_cov_0.630303_1_plen_23_part_10